jgi:hypothetical protein
MAWDGPVGGEGCYVWRIGEKEGLCAGYLGSGEGFTPWREPGGLEQQLKA